MMNGALEDTRPQKERDKDYDDKELASAPGVVPFKHKKINRLLKSVYSQEYTSSCVPHAFLTQLEYEGIVLPKPDGLSQLLTYRKRQNYPHPGSNAVDIYERIKEGQTKNVMAPVRPKHTEKDANGLPYLKGEQLIPSFLYFTITDYKKIPGYVSSGKAITIFIYASEEEWRKEYVTIDGAVNFHTAPVRHAVCLVPDGDFQENGHNWLTVHDSAGFGGRHLRYIREDFLMGRCYYASKVYKGTALPTPEPPVMVLPTEPCEFKQSSKAVQNLQAYLIKHNYLEPIYQTGYFGNLTAKALLEWQLVNANKFNYVRPVRELLSLEGKYFGKMSIEVIKTLENK